MKVIAAMAVSLDGMIAREDGREDWLPSEGWKDFLEDVRRYHTIVMGRETYELVNRLYPGDTFDDIMDALKIIVTHQRAYEVPEGYRVAHGPAEALSLVADSAYDTALVIGGGKLVAEFLKQGLLDELTLTYNPYILGKGRPFVASEELNVSLSLVAVTTRSLGRVECRYQVNKRPD